MRNNRATGNNATVTKLTTSDNHIKGYGTRQLSEHPFEVSFGRGKYGAPGIPQRIDGLRAFAVAIESAAKVARFPDDIDKEDYKAKKERGPWVMRAINEDTAFQVDQDTGAESYHRRIGSVTGCNWLMFDFDKMPYGAFAKTRRALTDSGFQALMYKSTGHNLDHKGGLEAFRVILPCVAVNETAAQALSNWLRENVLMTQFTSGEADPACDEPTRVIYLPFKGEPVTVINEDGKLFDAIACYQDHKDEMATLSKGRSDLTREEQAAVLESFGVFEPFAAWCLSNIEGAEILQKPDGRIALQMPGQQPKKYSGGNDGGDGWNFYAPSGGFSKLVFHSIHELTEPSETFKTGDAVGVLAKEYGSTPAQLYAAADSEANQTAAAADQKRNYSGAEDAEVRSNGDLPEPGAHPAGLTVNPMVFAEPELKEWPADIGWDRPEEPAAPADNEDPAYLKALAEYNDTLNEWDRQYKENRFQRAQWFRDSFVFVTKGSFVVDLQYPPHVEPAVIREWVTEHAGKKYMGTDARNKPKQFSYTDAWIQENDRLSAHAFRYAPGEPRLYKIGRVNYTNNFYLPSFAYTDDDDLLKDFFWLVDRTHPIAREAELFLSWVAFSFRYPQERILWAYVNVSPARGSGRGTLLNAISNLLGDHNVTSTSVGIVDEDKYHDWMHESTLVALEEADEDGKGKRIHITGKWNEIITARNRLINIKTKGQVKTGIYCNMAMFLNRPSLILDEEDRRINATTGAPAGIPPLGLQRASAFNALFKTEAFRNQLASFCWRRDLSEFDFTHSDRTLPMRAELLERSKSNIDREVEEIIEKSCGLIPASMISLLAADASRTLDLDAKVLADELRNRGKLVVPDSPNGKSVKCYRYRDFEESLAIVYKNNLTTNFMTK